MNDIQSFILNHLNFPIKKEICKLNFSLFLCLSILLRSNLFIFNSSLDKRINATNKNNIPTMKKTNIIYFNLL